MASGTTETESRMFDELQELVALEVKDILATAIQEGFEQRDVMTALELALRAEIDALATGEPLQDALVASPDAFTTAK